MLTFSFTSVCTVELVSVAQICPSLHAGVPMILQPLLPYKYTLQCNGVHIYKLVFTLTSSCAEHINIGMQFT